MRIVMVIVFIAFCVSLSKRISCARCCWRSTSTFKLSHKNKKDTLQTTLLIFYKNLLELANCLLFRNNGVINIILYVVRYNGTKHIQNRTVVDWNVNVNHKSSHSVICHTRTNSNGIIVEWLFFNRITPNISVKSIRLEQWYAFDDIYGYKTIYSWYTVSETKINVSLE